MSLGDPSDLLIFLFLLFLTTEEACGDDMLQTAGREAAETRFLF